MSRKRASITSIAERFRLKLLAMDVLEDRLTPSALNMSWSTGLPFDRMVGGQIVSMPGTGVSLSEQHQLNYLDQPPEMTDEIRARLEAYADRPLYATPAFPDEPFARENTTPATERPKTYTRSDDGANLTAPNDFVFFRNRVNAGADDPLAATSNINEPSVGALGRAAFETGNWYASVSGDNGATFRYIDPYDSFGDVGGSFCCDQRVAMHEGTSQLFWYLQYNTNGNTGTSFNGVRIARAIGQNGIADGAWTSWTFTPSSFGFGLGKWLDFPHMQVSANRLWATSNVFDIGGTSATHSVLWTIDTSELLAGGTINFSYWTRTDGFSLSPAQNAGTTMYVTSYFNTTNIRIYAITESPLSLTTTLKGGIGASYEATHNTPSPDGNNWTGRADNRIQSTFISGNTLTTMWNSSQGGSRPNSFIRILQVNVASSYSTVLDHDMWFSTGAGHYPAGSVNDRGHWAATYFYGDSTVSASPAVFLVDDITTTITGGTFAVTAANGGNNRWGDYLTSHQHNVYGNTWISSAYRLTGPGSGGGHQPNIEVRYLWFGRERDQPPILAPLTDVADTIAASTTILSGDGTASRTDVIWNAAHGRRDQDIFRFAPFSNTRVLLETSQPAGGTSMDTYLRLFNSAGTQLAADDDSGAGLYSQIKYTLTTGGNYYAGVTGFSNSGYNPSTAGSGTLGAMGDYTFTITTSAGTSITSLGPVSPNPRNSTVSFVDVTFSRTVDLATFNYLDVTLTRNGGSNLITSGVTVTFLTGTTYRIGNLSGLTGAEGNYVLSVNPAAINDSDGYPLYNPGVTSTSWVMDTTAPTIVDVIDVSPDPRNAPVSFIDVVFSEPVVQVSFAAVSITRNGSPVTLSGNETFTLVSGTTYRVGGLSEETGIQGSYTFAYNAFWVDDLAGNIGTGSASDSWVMDTTPPTVIDVINVSPDPRNSPVSTIQIVLSELVQFVTYSNISITRNSVPVSFSGNETWVLVSGTTYELGGLAEETALEGTYEFTFNMGGVLDLAGNAGSASSTASDTWVMDTTPPTVVDVIDISPDPRTTPVSTIQIVLSELVQFVTYSNISITRNSVPVSFSGNETWILVSGTIYELGGLAEETALPGTYVFTFNMGGVLDLAGNAGSASSTASDTWVTTGADSTPPGIANVFFNSTSWSAAFRTAAGNSTFGFPTGTGADQLRSIPWINVNQLFVQFTESIQGVTGGQIRINRQTGGTMVQGVDYTVSVAGAVATIHFAAPLGTNRYLIDLDGDGLDNLANPITPIRDLAGNPLAGSWIEGVSTFPSGGPAGQDFRFRFIVGVGDVDRNGLLRNADLNIVRGNLFNDLPSGTFNIFADIDGNGQIRNADLNNVRNNLFNDPPAGPGPNRPIRGEPAGKSEYRGAISSRRFTAANPPANADRGFVGRRIAQFVADDAANALDFAIGEFA